MVESRTLRPVEAYRCKLIENQTGDEANNLVEFATCTDCAHCAEVRTPWHRFGIRCVYPDSGLKYWTDLYGDEEQGLRSHTKAMGRFYKL